ncbi:MAG: EAL domain-containing protein [Lachnospiraceae bacterium]|nr:EAL domain-containing protein [Lachnospiraceae bacterium]
MEKIFEKTLYKFDNSRSISAIRRGFIMVIPMLMLGSFALLLKEFPINLYQELIRKVFSGAFLKMLNFIYDATLGMISIYIALVVSVKYVRMERLSNNYIYVCGLTSVASLFILTGVGTGSIETGVLGVKSIFVAVFCGIFVSKLFVLIIENLAIPFRLYADGVDMEFNDAVIAMIPCITIVALFSIGNYLVCQTFGVNSSLDFYIHILSGIFKGWGTPFINGFMIVIISGLMQFIGIYSNDILENLSHNILATNIYKGINTAEGKILSREFIEVFVLIGGCGTAICLLITIFIFGKRKINRSIAKISGIPTIFGFNEILMFGYPIIYNPYLLAPFLVTPMVAYCVSYLAFYFGLVPMITHEVEGTVPVILSGYQATGSVAGAVLQIVIVILGIFIYLPFVRMYEKSKNRNEALRMKELTDILKKAESDSEEIELLGLPGIPGAIAKCLAADLKNAIENREIRLYYQLQYNNDFKCIGAETLLRYNHPTHGFIYPPLVVKLAEEAGLLGKLERYLFEEAAKDYVNIKAITKKAYKISVNVTIATILENRFMNFLENLKRNYDIKDNEMCIEITEQMAIKSDSEFERVLNQVKKLGFMIAIDDFSMGSTSLKYLQKNQFDIVKLDGSIVREMMTNERSRDIISSIVYLAHSLNFSVLAEYVETEEQMQELKKIGCNYYQGYHFSKAVTVEEFLSIIQK